MPGRFLRGLRRAGAALDRILDWMGWPVRTLAGKANTRRLAWRRARCERKGHPMAGWVKSPLPGITPAYRCAQHDHAYRPTKHTPRGPKIIERGGSTGPTPAPPPRSQAEPPQPPTRRPSPCDNYLDDLQPWPYDNLGQMSGRCDNCGWSSRAHDSDPPPPVPTVTVVLNDPATDKGRPVVFVGTPDQMDKIRWVHLDKRRPTKMRLVPGARLDQRQVWVCTGPFPPGYETVPAHAARLIGPDARGALVWRPGSRPL